MFSAELQAKLNRLSSQQRRAITLIVEAEAEGVSFSRLLRTSYSCRWCGRVIGRSSDKADRRRSALALHEYGKDGDSSGRCARHGQPWRFAGNYTTYYRTWRHSKAFNEALTLAREEVTQEALTSAARILQLGTADAAAELRRQVTEAESDKDRRLSSVAILDRADIRTAGKVGDGLSQWLQELRDAGEGEGEAEGEDEGDTEEV